MGYRRRFKRYGRRALRAPFVGARYALRNADKANKALAIATLAARNIRYMKGLVNSERLYADTNLTSTATNAIFRLVNLANGDGANNRTGNSVLLRSLYLRGQIEINPSVTANTRYCIAIVRDMQQVSDTTPSLSDIFKDPTDPESMLNVSTAGRFKIIYRRSRALTPVTAGNNVHMIKIYKAMREHLRWNGSAATDVAKGHYYLCLLTSEVTNTPSFDVVCRSSYHDN